MIDILRNTKLRATPQRLAIYEEIKNDKSHPTADDIYRRVRVRHPHISFDTVNRTLLSFAKEGVLCVSEGRNSSRRFDSDTTCHDHFHCIICGKIIDFTSKDNHSSFKNKIEIKGVAKISGRKLLLEGICQQCAIEQKNK
jgi:Fur family peroxide stress response transcriptional regulator